MFNKVDIEKRLITQEDIIDTLEKKPLAFIRGMPHEDPYYVNANMGELRNKAIHAYNELTNSLSSDNATAPRRSEKEKPSNGSK